MQVPSSGSTVVQEAFELRRADGERRPERAPLMMCEAGPPPQSVITTRYRSPFQKAAGSLTSSFDDFEFGPPSTI